jgi:predicted CxxxxCH...CXXCH cytochrome family protein
MGDTTGSVPADFTGVCNVCHNTVVADHVHYTYTSSDGHRAGEDCTACHQHRNGFQGLDCNGCHGGSGSTGAPLINGDLVGVQDTYYPVTGHTEGAHPKHVTDQGITDCTICHTGHNMPTVDEVITIAFSGTATDNSSSPSYDGTALDSPYSYNGGVTTATGTQDCSNVYCHSSVQGAGGTGVPGSYATPDWGAASVTCDSCHGQATETDGQPNSGSHAMHAAAANNNYPCSACHTGGSGTLAHADGTIDIAIDGTYGGTYGQGSHAPGAGGYADCSNVYCHGDTLTAGVDTQPTWGGAVACGDCHGDDAATPPTAGSHVRHAGGAAGGLSRVCTDCHGAGAGGTGHTDSDVQWDLSAIDASATYSGSNTGATGAQAPSGAYSTCGTLYCHSNVQTSNGTAGPTLYESPTWGAASVVCDSCHGQDAEETDGQPASGSHNKHAGSQAGENNLAPRRRTRRGIIRREAAGTARVRTWPVITIQRRRTGARRCRTRETARTVTGTRRGR